MSAVENDPQEPYPGGQPPPYPGNPYYPPPPPGYPPPWMSAPYGGGDPNLDTIVAEYVSHGARVEARSANQAIVVFGHRVNNLAHGLLSLVTCGAWLFVWVIIAILGGERRITVTSQSRYQNPYKARNIALMCLGGFWALLMLIGLATNNTHHDTTPSSTPTSTTTGWSY
jgi:hypothetical protein